MSTQQPISSSRTISYVGASADTLLITALETHLHALEHQGVLTYLPGCKVTPAMKDLRSLQCTLDQTSIILLLISPDFLASDICDVVMWQAFKISSRERRVVMPILLRPVALEQTPFIHMQCLPRSGKFLSTLPKRDKGFVEIMEALIEICKEPLPFEPQPMLPAHLSGFIDIQHQVNRKRLLKHMRAVWIEQALEGQWLHDTTLMNLCLCEQPDAIADPQLPLTQELEQRSGGILPPDTRMIDVYEKTEGALLLLGEPGAGKTTLLLDLSRELIKRAEHNESDLLPVYLSCASWVKQRLSFDQWLVEELHASYAIGKKIARGWVRMQQVLPLLDDLDRLPAETLSACVEAINIYLQAHRKMSLVISCRSADYFAQSARLAVQEAVTIQSLTEQQIKCYLASAGKLEALLPVLTRDEALLTLTRTPLVLSMLAQTEYLPASRNPGPTDVATRRDEIFAAYVESMLMQRQEPEESIIYSAPQTSYWLTRLACHMQRHHQVIFNPERIQPNWLTEKRILVMYYLCSGLLGGCLLGLVLGLLGTIVGDQRSGLVAGLAGVLFGCVGFAFAARKGLPVETERGSSVKSMVGSLLPLLVLWLLVLLMNQAAGLSSIIIRLVLMLSLLPLLIGELLKERPEVLLDDLSAMSRNNDARQSARNGLRIGCIAGASFGLLLVFFQLSGMLIANLASYWFLASMLGLLTGLLSGGLAALQVKGLHWLFWHRELKLQHPGEFLDYAAKHLLLSKIGNSYLFRYPLLQDYFAALPQEQGSHSRLLR